MVCLPRWRFRGLTRVTGGNEVKIEGEELHLYREDDILGILKDKQ
jgi:co-chaperonin GroES (HSP10)